MNIKKRLYDDFLRPSKFEEYEKIIKIAAEEGYEFHTILSFEEVRESLDPLKKYLILRRDVDTPDFVSLYKMFTIEKKYNARCTYYFRKSTKNLQLMQYIQNGGGEPSYHYEELATYCYKYRIRNREKVLGHLSEIQITFLKNLKAFRKEIGLPCLTVASHGDYVNTKLGVQNAILMTNAIKESAGIVREAYDKEYMNALTCRLADQVLGEAFVEQAIAAIKRGEPVLELLTHPRQWNSPFIINFREEVGRVLKQIYMNL